MVEMQEQAFAAIEEAEAEDVVVNEGGNRSEYDIQDAEAGVAFGDGHLGAQRGLAVHVVEVVGEGGVGVVEEGAVELAGDSCGEPGVFVDEAVFESR